MCAECAACSLSASKLRFVQTGRTTIGHAVNLGDGSCVREEASPALKMGSVFPRGVRKEHLLLVHLEATKLEPW